MYTFPLLKYSFTFFMKLFLSSIIILSASLTIFAQQNKIDSLIQLTRSSTVDTIKIDALKNLAFSLSRKSPDRAEKFCKQCIDLSIKANSSAGFIKCNNIMGIISIYKTDYISALDYFNISLEKSKETNDKLSIYKAYNNIGSVYLNMSDYKNATNYYSMAVEIAEQLNDKRSIATSYTNIAVIHKDNSNYKLAKEYNQKAYKLAVELKDSLLESQILGNISKIYSKQQNIREAIEYSKKALKIQQAIDDKFGIGINYIDLGNYYYDMSNGNKSYKVSKSVALDSSRFYFIKAMSISINLEDEQRLCNSKTGLGKISYSKKDFDEAKWYFSDALKISLKTQNIEIAADTYSFLAQIDSAQGNYKGAFENHKLYKFYQDSIFSTEKMNSISEMEFKYQSEKKQQKIEILNKEKAIQKYKNRLLVIGIVLVAILLTLAIIAFIFKRRDNRLLHEKNEQIIKHREEIQAQADDLAEANKEILFQKAQIEKTHKNITDSIQYAKTIQRAVLPTHEMLAEILPQSFVLFKPRDIVSGDFYFVKKIKNEIIIAAADCTGHGVPGALLSMLGVAILNELVLKSDHKSPGKFLDELRLQIKTSLQQTGQKGEKQDGIDIAFCILNMETLILKFAGAYNPLIIVKANNDLNEQNEKEEHSDKFIEIKADRQPVGVYLRELPFSEQTIQLQKGDSVYLYSDGYLSQFGGVSGEKYKSVRLKQFITNINHIPMKEQKTMLENEFSSWKQDYEQTDDVLIMGFMI
jgi:serine phosphatase RsbU (regulator of sigma subunit)